MEQPPLTHPRVAAGLLVFVLALAANAWMLRLEFQNDDYREIPSAGMKLGFGAAPADSARSEAFRSQVYSYRPVLWAALSALTAVPGETPQPWIFHAFFLLGHAFASFLVWRLASARLGGAGGLAGGLLFALLPGGLQAASWVAAGGDQLAVSCVLLAAVASDRVLRGGSLAGVVGCGLAVGCAVLAKETAVALLPALALTWLVPPAGVAPSRGRLVKLAIAATAGVLAAGSLRASVMGTWMPLYWGGEWVSPLSYLALLPSALLGLAVPWHASNDPPNLDPLTPRILQALGLGGDAVHAAYVAIVVAALLLPLAIGFATASRRLRLALLALLAAGLVAILPVLPVTAFDGPYVSRALYPAALVLAAMAAASTRALSTRGPRLILLWAPFFLLSLDLLVHVARTELFVADLIRTARREFDGLLGRGDGARAVVLTPPDWVRATPFLGLRLGAAVSPPFGRALHPPDNWPNAETLRWCPALREVAAPLRILAWDGRQFDDLHPPLPRIPADAPALVEDPASRGTFRPATPAPPRGIAAIQVEAAAGSPASGSITFVAGARKRDVPFRLAGDGRPHLVSIPDEACDDAWLLEPSLDAVSIAGPALAKVPVLVLALPPIALERPAADRISLRSAPRFAFRSEAGAAFFRATFAWIEGVAAMTMSWTVPATAAASRSGTREILADETEVRIDGRVAAQVRWQEIAAVLEGAARRRMWAIPGGLRVEALDASGTNVIARSPWMPLTIVR